MTSEPINKIKHKRNLYLIKKLYAKHDRDIVSLINQSGNLFEVILAPSADFDAVAKLLKDYSGRSHKKRDFFMVWLLQVGNEKMEIFAINSIYLTYNIHLNGRIRTFYLVQLFGNDEIDVYEDYKYQDVLRKYKGEWFIYGNSELAKLLGNLIENDEEFVRLGFRIQNYKKFGE